MASRFRTLVLLAFALTMTWPASALGLELAGRLQHGGGPFDAIVVAGCRLMPDGRPSKALARRTRAAVELWRAGVAPQVVFTGGVGVSSTSEAAGAARFARELGLPAGVIVLEERSHSTEENARFAAEAIGEARVLVVTDAYHGFRCRRVFARYFEEADSHGVVGPVAERLPGMLREVPAVAWYALHGRL